MQAALITRKEAALLSGASESAINKAIEQRVVDTTAVSRQALLDARDVAAFALFADLKITVSVTQKRRIRRWLRGADVGAETSLGPHVVVRMSEDLGRTASAALRYAQLKERYLEINPDRQGGEPVIRGTRIPIRGLAKQIEAGETTDELRRQYDYIDDDAFEFAVQWARSNPRRGRPRFDRPRSAVGEPAARGGYIERRRHRQSGDG